MGIDLNRFHYFHVIGKVEQEFWPGLPMDYIWSAFNNHLSLLKQRFDFTAHAFVLMGNHFHLLASSSSPDISYALEELVESLQSSFTLGNYWEDLFTEGLKVIPINDITQYRETYKYIYQNPVQAGLVDAAEEYPFSTLGAILEGSDDDCSCIDNMNLIVDPHKVLNWINHSFEINRYH